MLTLAIPDPVAPHGGAREKPIPPVAPVCAPDTAARA